MSLRTHGNDRDIDRAQHLLSYGADEQSAHLAAAPGSKQNAVRVELPGRGENLLGCVPFAHQGVAHHVVSASLLAGCFQRPGGGVQRAYRVVVGHPRNVGGNGLAECNHVEKDQPRSRLRSLIHSERHKAVEIAQVGGDQDHGRMRPT